MASRVLVTGGRGLIGEQTCRILRKSDHEVVLAEDVLPELDLLEPGMVTRLLDVANPHSVLHLAWVASGTRGYRNHSDNRRWVQATLDLALGCLDASVDFFGTGSVAEIDAVDTDEYTRAKSSVWCGLRPLIESRELTWFRPYYVFDPELGRPEVVREVLDSIREGRAPTLHSPEARHDFVHVADVASGVAAAVDCQLRGLVPIGSGTSRSVAELARAVGARPMPSKWTPEIEPLARLADTSVLRAIGWVPRWTDQFFAIQKPASLTE